jgi:uncharacterized protein
MHMLCRAQRPSFRAKRVAIASALTIGALATSCSRTPEEPSPATRVTNDPESKAMRDGDRVDPIRTAAPSKPSCPVDDDPDAVTRLFGHGEASFVTPDGTRHTFQMELAQSEKSQERGLMFRTALADDHGMVFEFATPHQATFWMHNTCIALDMVFVSPERRVIGVVTAPPLNDEPRGVPGVSKWVVELGAGVAKKKGIAIGTTFEPSK